MSRKQRQRKKFFLKHPKCCFCGGGEPATTIDHVPPRQMFSLKRRPAGLECPACHPCNQVTAIHEQVAAMMARLYPDPTTKAEQREFEKLLRGVRASIPGLLEELYPSWVQQHDFRESGVAKDGRARPMSASGPLLNRSMEIFGVKLSCALHYHQTGRIIPSDGGIAFKWYTNYDKLTDRIPEALLNLLGENRATLSQGSWRVEEQFEYTWAIPEGARMGAYFAAFRQSFAVLGFVHDDREMSKDIPNMKARGPDTGWVKSPKHAAEAHEDAL